MEMIFHAHSGLRYLVLLAGLVAAVHALLGMLRSRPYDDAGRILLSVFVGIVDLQVLLGVVLVFLWPFYGQLIGHIVMMLAAAVTAHVVSVVQKRRPPERKSWGLQLGGVLGVLVLIVAGILAIGRSVL